MTDYSEIIEHLRQIKTEKGLSYEQIGRMGNMSGACVASYLGGNRFNRSNTESIRKIAAVLDPELVVPDKETKCQYCGTEFKPYNDLQIFCCGRCRDFFYADERRKAKKERDEKAEMQKKVKKKIRTLQQMAKEANEHGMTYGEYVVMVEGEQYGRN